MDKEKRKYIGIQTRLSISIASKMILVSGIMLFLLFLFVRRNLRNEIRERLLETVSIASLQINGDLHDMIVPESGRDSYQYQLILKNLKAIKQAGKGIKYVYTMRENGNGNILFVIDGDYDPDKINPDIAFISEIYDNASEKLKQVFPTLQKPVTEDFFYHVEDDRILSGYAPFYNSHGQRSGVLGMDLAASHVTEWERKFFAIIMGIFLITIPVSIITGWYDGRKIAIPLNNLKHMAESYPNYDTEHLHEINSADEVGDLARAFYSMAQQLRMSFEKIENQNYFLKQEIEVRSQAEAKLANYQKELEGLVVQRTADLTENQRQLQTLLANLPGMAYRRYNDKDLNLEFASEGCKQLTGYEPDKIINSKELSWHHIVHPDYLEHLQNVMSKAMAEKKPFQCEYQIIHANKKNTWVWEQGRGVFGATGELIAIEGFLSDISNRKRAEEALLDSERKYRYLVENINDVIYSINSEGIITYISPHFETLSGYTPEEAIGRHLEDFIYADDVFEMRQAIEETLYGMLDTYAEFRIVAKSGKMVWTLLRGQNEVNAGSFVGMRGVFSDISELKRAQEEMLEAKNEADKANKSKSIFLANMSHEIRTPMNAILGFAEILERKIKDESYAGYLSAITAAGKNLLSLINDILDLSKIEAGRLELQYDAVNPGTILEEIKQIFLWKIAEKELEFQINIDRDVPDAMILDEVRLRQILLNVVGNAVKFTDQGSILLSVRMLKINTDRSKADIEFTVRDTGIGVANNQQERIFEAFRQQDGQSNSKYGGTGLGLAITRRLVNMMNGEISIKSEKGKGSTFHILLKNVTIAASTSNSLESATLGTSHVRFTESTVLVADDVSTNRILIRGFLDGTQLTIIEATNGQEAFELTQKHHPDIILMDMKMPLMDGLESTRKLKQDTDLRNIPIIALTAMAMKEDKEAISKAGCDGYLTKPVGMEDIIFELMRFLPYTTDSAEPELPESGLIVLNENQIARLPELISNIDKEGIPYWERISKTPIISKIRGFAESISEMGMKFEIPIVTVWGNNLLSLADSFDVEKMQQKVSEFP
ncbi:MAG: PAS domain S-box protein, partial [Candidatus Cloacimonetes bacterium]|nr:PAS domain S-box protein [Candidatus Cloacimonadota bacterium]